MAVNKSDRKKSRTEYDNSFFVVYHDAVNLCRLHLGAKGETFECNKGYIARMSNKILDSVTDMGKYIRIANSIYPIYKSELEERRIAQEKAIGLCFDVLTKYQLAMKELGVPDDKYTNEIKHLMHEINCLKSWRTSDNERYKNLG